MTGPQRLADVPFWYHTIAFPDGLTTPGQVDHRGIVDRVLPPELTAQRALDVGTFDGFWAFEMERRGATTYAVDVATLDAAEWPPLNRARHEAQAAEWQLHLGDGFRLAREKLGSEVTHVLTSVYDLDPAQLGGRVDFAFAGAILLHLRDPVRALERILACLRPGGVLLQMEPFSVRNSLTSPRRPVGSFEPLVSDFTWWMPNVSALKAWPWAAGFVDVRRTAFVRPASTRVMRGWYAVIASRKPEA